MARLSRIGGRTKLGLCAAALPIGLLITEVALRCIDLGPPPLPQAEGRVLSFVEDPVLLFENLPNSMLTLKYRDHPEAPARVVTARVNADHFRGPLRTLEKPPGVYRIACLGDSHTFGHGVDDDSTWPAYLQREFAQKGSEQVEVMNCGVNGYDTMQEVLWLEKRVLAFEPDLVLLQYYINDTAARGLPKGQPVARDRIFEFTHPKREGWIGAVRSRSYFADLVLDSIHRKRSLAVYSSMRLTRYSEGRPGWERVQEALLRARDLLEARDIRFALVLYPFLVRQGDQLTSHAAFEIVKDFCERSGIPYLDTESAFLGEQLARLRVHEQDYHANAQANHIFAAAVGKWLGTLDLLGSVAAR